MLGHEEKQYLVRKKTSRIRSQKTVSYTVNLNGRENRDLPKIVIRWDVGNRARGICRLVYG